MNRLLTYLLNGWEWTGQQVIIDDGYIYVPIRPRRAERIFVPVGGDPVPFDWRDAR